MTRQKYQFYFKMSRMLKTELCAKSGSIAMITFRNIANKLFLPVKAFDPRSRLFPHYRFSGPSSQMFTGEAFFWFEKVCINTQLYVCCFEDKKKSVLQ